MKPLLLCLSLMFCAAAYAETPIEIGAQTCVAEVPKRIGFKDPDSVRIGEATGGKMEVIDYADRRMPARKYTVMINARNGYGAYGGAKPLTCFTSEDGRRILRMVGARFD
jgi:hypothetical protein